jgi:uroporphyrinogen-III decarboxylase
MPTPVLFAGGAKSYNKAKAWLYKHPKEARELLQRITDVTVEYLLGQVRAGAQVTTPTPSVRCVFVRGEMW